MPMMLAPYISAETIDFHYGKHHQTYVNNLNKLIEGTDYEHEPLEHIILNAEGGLSLTTQPKYGTTAFTGTA